MSDKTCSTLFIGGIADGQRRPDPESQFCEVAGAEAIPRADQDDLYRREMLRSGREVWVIYVLDSLTTEQAMGKLVDGYSPNARAMTPGENENENE